MPNQSQKPCENKAFPTLVFLHGLLGDRSDWATVIEKIQQNAPHFRCLSFDLPLHGDNQALVDNLEQAASWLDQKIQIELAQRPYCLIGYSLGGRIALHYLCHYPLQSNLQTIILEGANFGLNSEVECQARWFNDEKWATRFEQETLADVLNDWYQQPVFSSLNTDQRQYLIAKRQQQTGSQIARMLRATSLAKQQNLSTKLHQILNKSAVDFYYFFGEKDTKFRQLAQTQQFPYRMIANAGHNSHWENPTDFVIQLLDVI